MPTVIHQRVAALHEGRDATFVARVASGWVVLGDPQVLRGYCLLLPDPVVGDLGDLGGSARTQFLEDMARLGDVVRAVTGAKRINYAMLGNQEPALHAHVIPRFSNEPEGVRGSHPWAYDWSAAPRFDAARDAPLIAALRQALESGR